MTPNPRDGQEHRPMFSGHCVWCDRHYFQREPAILYITTDDNGDPWNHHAHPCCHRLVLAYLDATGEAMLEREPDIIVAREILQRRPDLLDALGAQDAAWLKSRLLPPPTLDAAQIEALRLEWVGLRDTLTQAREAMQAEMRRWDELQSAYGRRTKQYREARTSALEPYIRANDAATWAVAKFENKHARGFRFPWEPAKTQEPHP